MLPQPRELTDDYRLERILASSRGASILGATALASGQAVVVKLINVPAAASPARAAAATARFSVTASALAAVRHPNLPRILDSGMTPDGGAFLVMERLEGVGFDAHILATGGSPAEVLPLLAQALAGLEELARHGLAHLNVAPENLFLTAAGGAATPTVKLLGLETPIFHLGEAAGDTESFRFRAPELALPATAAAAFADWHADCYSLALTACNALGATVAFGEAPGPIVQMPLALSFELDNDEALRQILERCLRRVPAQRPTHAEIRDAFGLALGAPLTPAALADPAGTANSASPAWTAAEFPAAPAARSAPAAMPSPPSPAASLAPPAKAASAASAASRAPSTSAAAATAVPWTEPGASPLAAAGGEQPAARPAFVSPASAPPTEGWRTALSSQVLAAEAPSWRAARPLDPARPGQPPAAALPAVPIAAMRGEPLAAAPAVPITPLPTAAVRGAPLAAPPADPVSGRPEDGRDGSDSFLDLFAMPDSLPDLLEEPAGGLGAAGGEMGSSPLSATEMAAALGLDRSAGAGGSVESPFGSSLWDAAPMPGEALPGLPDLTAPAPDAASPRPVAANPRSSLAPSAAGYTSPPVGAIHPPPSPPSGIATPPAGAPLTPTTPTAPTAPTTPTAPAGPTVPAAALPAAAGLPAASSAASAAAPDGEMLSAVDDLLGSLPPPPPVQPAAAQRSSRPAAGSAAPPAAGVQTRGAAAATAGGGRPAPLELLLGLPRLLLLGAAAALVLAITAGAFLLLRHRAGPAGSPADAVPAEAAAAPPEKPGRSAAAKFFDAKSYLILGRESDGRVRQAVREMSFGEQGELGEGGCRELRSIEQTLAAAALETAPQDLATGLRNGDLGLLAAVASVATDQDVPANQRVELERARSLAKLYDEARSAAARGDQAEVLDRFRSLEGLSRNLHDPLSLREKAAAVLEADAAALAQDGKYDQAIGRLEPLRRSWPERAGIKDLLKTYESAAANETAQLAILDDVPNILRRRKPSEGLDALRTVKPTPHLAARIQDAIQQLETQLAQLDAQPPQVALRDDFPLDYSRGQVVTLSFRVTDDYQVKTVRFFARPEGGSMREMPLQKVGLAYTIQIPPAFHQNGTVGFYVVATDLSGHEGTLGSREKPLQIKRRQGFERLLQ
jgi:hypothetical protein